MNDISYQNLIMLANSVPKSKHDKEKNEKKQEESIVSFFQSKN